jgi:hypothetical protein
MASATSEPQPGTFPAILLICLSGEDDLVVLQGNPPVTVTIF